MTTGLLITRPSAQAGSTATRVRERGYQPYFAPLLSIQALDWHGPATLPQAVLLTSANAVVGLAASPLPRDLPVYTVGAHTAEQTRAAGFTAVLSADGNVTALAALITANCIPTNGTLLYLRGQDVAGELESVLTQLSYKIEPHIVYCAEPATSLPADIEPAVANGQISGALLYSPRSAAIFAKLTSLRIIALYCLSPAVAAAAGPGWAGIKIAAHPDENSLLELLPKV